MTPLRHHYNMPNTDERGEIAGRVNAKAAEVIQQSKKLASKTKQLSASMDAKNRLRSAETGLALMGFGFVVARFGLFLQQLQVTQHAPSAQSYGLSLWFGTALVALGVVVNLLSAWHHLRLVRELERGGVVHSRPSTQALMVA
jgi:Domain of unknown function (DUF202)